MASTVSNAMRKRIAAELDRGELPSLKKRRMHLGNVALQFANGTDRPALAEVRTQMQLRGLDTTNAFDAFEPELYTRGNRTFAKDIAGTEHTVARKVRGEHRVTRTGKRMQNDSYTRWICHLPVYVERNGQRFRDDTFNITGEQLGLSLNARGSDEQQLATLNRLVDAWVASGAAEQALVLPSDFGRTARIKIDTSKRPTFDKQFVGLRDGRYTINTILDRVVFGEPVFADDLWQRHHLHECSRRRNGECGLDVIVASAMQCHGEARKAMLTAEKAAQVLVNLARPIDPDGALATHSNFCEVASTAEIESIDEDLRLRAVDGQLLEPFKAGMLAYLAKSRSIDEI